MVRPFCVVLRRADVVQSHPTRPSRPDMHMLRLFALRSRVQCHGFHMPSAVRALLEPKRSCACSAVMRDPHGLLRVCLEFPRPRFSNSVPLLAFRFAVAVPAAVALRASPPALASLAFLATTP